MDAKDPTNDDGDDSLAPKRSAVNEEGEHPFFLPSIISFLLFQPNKQNRLQKQEIETKKDPVERQGQDLEKKKAPVEKICSR